MEWEYNGEKVIAKYEAKIVPSNSDHFDFVSTLMLTDQYLYVLEDNTDGSYAEYFKFGIKEMDVIEVQRVSVKAKAGQQAKSGLARILEDIGMYFAGFIRVSSIQTERQEKWDSGYLILKYHNGQGQEDRLYFRMGYKEPDDFVQAFLKLRESYGYQI